MGDVNLTPVKVTCDLTPLVQSIPNGVGKIFDLFFGKKIAKKEAVKKLIEAQTERQTRLIIDGKASLDDSGNFVNHEQVAEDNINQCLELAVNEAMSRNSEPSLEDISMTFFNKWREHAKNIDELHLKQLWAKILVDEVYEPNTINLSALNSISMLSMYEAEVFQSSIKYMIGNDYLIADLIPFSKRDEMLDTLFSIGAIAEIPNPSFRVVSGIGQFENDSYMYDFFYQQESKLCIAFHLSKTGIKENDKHLSFQLVKLTTLGKVLYNLAYSYDEESSISLAKEISKDMLSTQNVVAISVYQMDNNSAKTKLFTKTFS
ncbi:DUF2806 domain-containing protein [Actinobacillus lignieresii]|uniref:Protein of uncharacterized function (DUF2806) n=1 Tax=Actinobacillus lignieresii TaxID=720 RepID=A0A380TUN1_ACTLI|nr:DUF2806 domain-containing protein [Actinobacillus lignieresii]SUT92270.1 Protein of uncharacterised function (DUF2806) [Actinobacillus lignieresii]